MGTAVRAPAGSTLAPTHNGQSTLHPPKPCFIAKSYPADPEGAAGDGLAGGLRGGAGGGGGGAGQDLAPRPRPRPPPRHFFGRAAAGWCDARHGAATAGLRTGGRHRGQPRLPLAPPHRHPARHQGVAAAAGESALQAGPGAAAQSPAPRPLRLPRQARQHRQRRPALPRPQPAAGHLQPTGGCEVWLSITVFCQETVLAEKAVAAAGQQLCVLLGFRTSGTSREAGRAWRDWTGITPLYRALSRQPDVQVTEPFFLQFCCALWPAGAPGGVPGMPERGPGALPPPGAALPPGRQQAPRPGHRAQVR